MLKRHQMMSLMLLLVAMLSGCASEKAETEVPTPPVVIEESKDPESMSLLLACAPANSNSASTRLADEVVQLNDYYRKITNFRFVALRNGLIIILIIRMFRILDIITRIIAAWPMV